MQGKLGRASEAAFTGSESEEFTAVEAFGLVGEYKVVLPLHIEEYKIFRLR